MRRFPATLLNNRTEPLSADVGATSPAAAAVGNANELSRQATDPTASLMAFNFQGSLVRRTRSHDLESGL